MKKHDNNGSTDYIIILQKHICSFFINTIGWNIRKINVNYGMHRIYTYAGLTWEIVELSFSKQQKYEFAQED